jgi:hypothetical protein
MHKVLTPQKHEVIRELFVNGKRRLPVPAARSNAVVIRLLS